MSGLRPITTERDRQTSNTGERERDRQTDRQTDRQVTLERQTETDRQTNKQVNNVRFSGQFTFRLAWKPGVTTCASVFRLAVRYKRGMMLDSSADNNRRDPPNNCHGMKIADCRVGLVGKVSRYM